MDVNEELSSEIISRPEPVGRVEDSDTASLSRTTTPLTSPSAPDHTAPPSAPRFSARSRCSPFASYFERIRTPSEQNCYTYKTKSPKYPASILHTPIPGDAPKQEHNAGDKSNSRGTSVDSNVMEKLHAHDLERNSPWPSAENLKQQALKAKQQRMSRNFLGQAWANLTQKQRNGVRLALFMLILAMAIALGLGISFAVKGRVVSGVDGLTQPIQGASQGAS